MKLRKGILFSRGAFQTYLALEKYFQDKPYKIYKEVPVRQVIDVDKSELAPEEWEYFIQAPFDFVICREDNESQPFELIIEYDGIQHEISDTQAKKDDLKNRLCIKVSLPILRIGVEDIKVRGNLTFLEYMLDWYFVGKDLNKLKEKGAIDQDIEVSDLFIPELNEFPETLKIRGRLLKKGVVIPQVALSSIEGRYWCQEFEKDLNLSSDKNSSQRYWKAKVQLNIIKGLQVDTPLISVERSVSLRECNPKYNVPGVERPHLVIQLAKYLCFEALEKEVENFFAPK